MTDNLDPNPVALTEAQFDPTKDWLKELVGPGKKFDSVESLAKGKAESDSYIKTLEGRTDELRNDYIKTREELNARARLEELVNQIQAASAASASKGETPNETPKPEIKTEDVKNLVASMLNQSKADEQRNSNLNTVREALTKRFGSNYKTEDLARGIGMSKDDFTSLSASSPTVVIKALGLDKAQSTDSGFSPPPVTSRSSAAFTPTTGVRTEAYYDKLYKDDPVKYFSREVTLQRHADAQKMGEAFFDTE